MSQVARAYESDACWSNAHHGCDDPLCLCSSHRTQVWDPWDEAWKPAVSAAAEGTGTP